MKTYEVWVSVETMFKYRIRADNPEDAHDIAQDQWNVGDETNLKEESCDRVETCYCKEVEE